MKLLDAAELNPPLPTPSPGAPTQDRWLANFNGVSRACGVHIESLDPCPVDPVSGVATGSVQIRGTVTSHAATYLVGAFPINAYLRRSVACQQADDKEWLAKAFSNVAEYVLAISLVKKLNSDTNVWIGDAAVQSVGLADATTAVLTTAVIAARKLWFQTVTSEDGLPYMHVPPSMAPQLQGAGILLQTGPEEVSSIWGDKVIIAAGYEERATTPRVFFTPRPKVHITPPNDLVDLFDRRINNVALNINEFAAVDIAPCSIVRVGT
jgi:hypothetical protein